MEMMGEEIKAYLDDRTSLGKSESVSTADWRGDGERWILQQGESFNTVTEQNGRHTRTRRLSWTLLRN